MKNLKLIFLILISVGALMGSIGQIFYSIDSLYGLFAITGLAVFWTNIAVSIPSLFIRAETRIPAIKTLLENKPNSDQKSTEGVSKPLLWVVGISTLISGIAGTGSSYLGGTVVADILHIENKIPLMVFSSYVALSYFIATFSFFGTAAISNCRMITEFFNKKDNSVTQSKLTIAKNVIKTLLISGVGAVTFSSFSFFTLVGTVKLATDDMLIVVPLALIGSGSTLITTVFARVFETYKYFSMSSTAEQVQVKRSLTKRVLISPLLLLGYLDIFVFDAVMYSSCLNNLGLLGVNPTSYLVLFLSLFPSTSAAAMHYIFTVEKVNKKYRAMTVIEENAPTQSTTEVINSNPSDVESIPFIVPEPTVVVVDSELPKPATAQIEGYQVPVQRVVSQGTPATWLKSSGTFGSSHRATEPGVAGVVPSNKWCAIL